MAELPDKMCGVYLTGHGGPEVLEYREDIAVPKPGANDVLVKVFAAGVNNTDINTRMVWYSKNNSSDEDASWSGKALKLPLIQGADVCGTIISVGRNVD
ncbi:MAG: alcohol dehydrogenase catalytic domain-containing protein [Candidatus Thiodiazotropha sp. (ex. Lucinoma kazani)]